MNSKIKKIKEFLKPTKRKIMIAILLPFILTAIILSISEIIEQIQTNTSESEKGTIIQISHNDDIKTDFYKQIINYFLKYGQYIIAGLIISILYHYPLACFISNLISEHKKNGFKSIFSIKNTTKLIILLLIFNPITLQLINFLFLFYTTPQYIPCGLQIINITKNGPIDNAGISEGEIIYEINSNSWSVFTYKNKDIEYYLIPRLNPEDKINIITNKNSYVVEVGKTKYDKPYLGFVITQNKCICGNNICEKGEEYISKKESTNIKNKEQFPNNYIDLGCKKDCN